MDKNLIPRPSEMSPGTMEETSFFIPVVENGPSFLGDLWHCGSSSYTGSNIFGALNESETSLREELVEIHSIQSQNYTMRHMKDVHDKLASLHVDAHVSLEMQAADLKVHGGASFDTEEESHFKEETLFIQLDVSTFNIRVRESGLDGIIDEEVKKRVQAGEATHYVKEIRLGAYALGDVRVSELLDDSSLAFTGELGGEFEIKTPIGPITIGIELSMKWLEENGSSRYSTTVSLVSNPYAGGENIAKVSDMFDYIRRLDNQIRIRYREDFFKKYHLYGIPVRFKLAPLRELFKMEASPSYTLLDEDTVGIFSEMLATLYEFRVEGYVKRALRTKDVRISTIFYSYTDGSRDEKSGIKATYNENLFTEAVTVYEVDLKARAQILHEAAVNTFRKYKNKLADNSDLTAHINEYQRQFNLYSISEAINAFYKEGKEILNAVHAVDASLAGKPNLFIKSQYELINWFNLDGGIKILLNTNGEQPEGVFLKLYTMTPDLEAAGVQVRVAYHNLKPEPNFSLQIKIYSDVDVSEYFGEDIPYVLDILSIVIGKGGQCASLFYLTLAQHRGRKASIEKLTSLVQFFKEYSNNLQICETYPRFLNAINTPTPEFKFVIPVQGQRSLWEMIEAYVRLRKEILKYPHVSYKWIVASVIPNQDENDAPLLLVFQGTLLRAICLDQLDLFILWNELSASLAPDLSVLDPGSIKEFSMYSRRTNFATKFVQLISADHRSVVFEPISDLPSFIPLKITELTECTLATEAACSGNGIHFASTIARLANSQYKNLPLMLERYCWSDLTGFAHTTEQNVWEKLGTELQEFIEDEKRDLDTTNVELDNLRNVISLRDAVHAFGSGKPAPVSEICLDYWWRLKKNEDLDNIDDTVRTSITIALQEKSFHQALWLLSQLQYHPNLAKMQYDISSLLLLEFQDMKQCRLILEAMKGQYKFTDEQIADIWSNPKFRYWVNLGVGNDILCEKIGQLFCSDEIGIPPWIPPLIAEQIKMSPSFGPDFFSGYDWHQDWISIQDAISALQAIQVRDVLPKNFASILREILEKNEELRNAMRMRRALFYWNESDLLLDAPWNLQTIRLALANLKTDIDAENSLGIYKIILPKQNLSTAPKSSLSNNGTSSPIPVNALWTPFTNGYLEPINSDILFNTAQTVIPFQPLVQLSKLGSTIQQILPYICQELKRFNIINSISPANVMQYVDYKLKLNGAQIGIPVNLRQEENHFVMSRSDLLVAMLTAGDHLLVHTILNQMARIPLPLPLAIPDITAHSLQLSTTDPAEQIPVKFLKDMILGLTIQDHPYPQKLLVQPFKMVVALRIGTPQIGKSSILNNLLFKTQHFFSSRQEPGAEIGASISRPGFVELTWLSSSICNEEFWEKVEPHYPNNESGPIFLVNVHGDAMQLSELFSRLQDMSTAFLVFWSVPTWSELIAKRKIIEELIGARNKALHILLDPPQEISQRAGFQNCIRTNDLKEASSRFFDIVEDAISRTNPASKSSEGLSIKEAISTLESTALMSFVKNHGVLAVKQAVVSLDANNLVLSEALRLFVEILKLETVERMKALAHVESELEHLSLKSSSSALEHLLFLEKNFPALMQNQFQDSDAVTEYANNIKNANGNFHANDLEIGDFLQVLLSSDIDSVSVYPLLLKHLQGGYPLNILNCTYGGNMWSPALSYCFQQIDQNTRIFVLSVTGLRGNYKSTLLNNLFGKGFREGPGGCTKGIDLRIIYLSQDLSEDLEIDAILLLDVEGFRATQNALDDSAFRNEVQLLSFVLGVSHLTLVSSVGESMAGMQDCLFASLINMYQLAEPNHRIPDILVIQNQENPFETTTVTEELQEIIDILEPKNPSSHFELGARTTSLLDQIRCRANSKNATLHTESRSAPDVQSIRLIYDEVINMIQNMEDVTNIKDWYGQSQVLWDALTAGRDLQIFNGIQKWKHYNLKKQKLDKILAAIEQAFRNHEDIIEEYLTAIGDKDVDPGTMLKILNRMPNNCDKNEGDACQKCVNVVDLQELFFQTYSVEAFEEIRLYARSLREKLRGNCVHMGLAKELRDGIKDGMLSKELDAIKDDFDGVADQWVKFKQFLSTQILVIPGVRLIDEETRIVYKNFPHLTERLSDLLESIELDCPVSLKNIPALDFERNMELSPLVPAPRIVLNWREYRRLEIQLLDSITVLIGESGPYVYSMGMIATLQQKTTLLISDFEKTHNLKFLPDFKWEVHFRAVIHFAKQIHTNEHDWNSDNGLLFLLENNKEKFPDIFNN